MTVNVGATLSAQALIERTSEREIWIGGNAPQLRRISLTSPHLASAHLTSPYLTSSRLASLESSLPPFPHLLRTCELVRPMRGKDRPGQLGDWYTFLASRSITNIAIRKPNRFASDLEIHFAQRRPRTFTRQVALTLVSLHLTSHRDEIGKVT